jgi:polysaccharide export outer membrane protein
MNFAQRYQLGRWQAVSALLIVCVAMFPRFAFAQAQPPARAPSQGQAAGPQAASASSGYDLQPGDILEILVWREADLTKEVLIRPDGGISFPLAGDLQASGRTIQQLRDELATRLGRVIPDVDVTVLLKEVKGNKIYVIGQVAKPGEFIVNPQVDVMQALTMAGGTTAFASLGDIFVLRRNQGRQERIGFDFNAVARGRDLQQNIMLQSGDVLVVP